MTCVGCGWLEEASGEGQITGIEEWREFRTGREVGSEDRNEGRGVPINLTHCCHVHCHAQRQCPRAEGYWTEDQWNRILGVFHPKGRPGRFHVGSLRPEGTPWEPRIESRYGCTTGKQAPLDWGWEDHEPHSSDKNVPAAWPSDKSLVS